MNGNNRKEIKMIEKEKRVVFISKTTGAEKLSVNM